MITPDYVRLMARYNEWQNQGLFAAADLAFMPGQRRAPPEPPDVRRG